MDQIGQYCDGILFLTHDLINERMYELAKNHSKCVEIRHWKKRFNNLSQLQFCLNWASEIKPKYVLEFDEDEIPPYHFNEVFNEFKRGDKTTLWLKGIWAYNNLDQIAIEPMRKYFFHMKAYKWSKALAKQERAGFNSFRGITYKSDSAFLSKYSLKHLAFLTPRLRNHRMIVGGSKGHKYNNSSWFMQNVNTVPYDKNKTNKDWMKIYHETISNNS